jgi:ribosomal protein L16 Arg81 hydroxylase
MSMSAIVELVGPETVLGLDLLLGGFDRKRFFSEHWERRSLHLAHGDPGRFSHLLSVESFLETEVRRCAELRANTRDAQGWNVDIPIQPAQAAKMFRAGMTICATALDESGPRGEVLREHRRVISCAPSVQFNCYYSPDGRGFGLHFDTHPVWILQVSGSKHWTVSREPGVRNPLTNVVYPPGLDRVRLPWITLDRPDADNPERFMNVRLDPGDVLYLPAGCWHAAAAEGPSLALTLALGRVTTMDLLAVLLQSLAARGLPAATTRLPAFPVPDADGGEGRAQFTAQLATDLEQLKELIQKCDAAALVKVHEELARGRRS